LISSCPETAEMAVLGQVLTLKRKQLRFGSLLLSEVMAALASLSDVKCKCFLF
jgi:hypothetical protein